MENGKQRERKRGAAQAAHRSAPRLAAPADACCSRSRKADGASPTTRRNIRLNCERDWNPAPKAASLNRIGVSVCEGIIEYSYYTSQARPDPQLGVRNPIARVISSFAQDRSAWSFSAPWAVEPCGPWPFFVELPPGTLASDWHLRSRCQHRSRVSGRFRRQR